jgi:signal transduction histidine kinase
LTALLVAGWLVAGALGLVLLALRRRLALVADAEHELRGPLTAIELGMGRLPGGSGLRLTLTSELERARTALADLTAARRGGRAHRPAVPVPLHGLVASCADAWSGQAARVALTAEPATIQADPGRLSQALGNVVSNAVEHGAGPVRIDARRVGGGMRIEVLNAVGPAPGPGRRDGDRGRGLRIAARAARDAGGTLYVARGPRQVAAVLDLPVDP